MIKILNQSEIELINESLEQINKHINMLLDQKASLEQALERGYMIIK